MKNIELVFRSVGERTSEIALNLAIENIQPSQVHVIENIKPFSEAVKRMLYINYNCDNVVFMDADCLILEDMRPFLEHNIYAYVDCYVNDKFRGTIHQGVHITRIDLVRAMQEVEIPENDRKYVLRPESRIRNFALLKIKETKHFKHFRIFHDWFQYYHDIFAKYALRELRSRTQDKEVELLAAEKYWQTQPFDWDYLVARKALAHTRSTISKSISPSELAEAIAKLPEIAAIEVEKLNLPTQLPLTLEEVTDRAKKQWNWQLIKTRQNDDKPGWNKPKVFGIGLSRTGTKTLTSSLYHLGINTIHYPDDATTLRELASGNYKFSVLKEFDGITDITVAPFYPQLDRLFPGSKFILTVRDKETWLKSIEQHWYGRSAFSDLPYLPSEREIHMRIRRLLRSAVYGCYEFSRDRLSYVYDLHYKNVTDYFKNKPESLLVLDICAGEGWEKLCPFLGKPHIDKPFPYIRKKKVLKALLM